MKLTLPRSGWLALVAALATLAPSPSFAATYTWTGGGAGTDWFTSIGGPILTGNWSSAGSLTASDNLVFDSTGAAKLGPNQNGSATVNDLTFAAGAPAYSLATGFFSTLQINGTLLNASSNVQILNGGFTIMGPGSTLDTGTAGITIAPLFAGANNFTKSGAGVLNISAGSSYSGTMTLSAGTVVPGSSFSASVIANGGTMSATSISGNVIVNSGSIAGTGVVSGFVQMNGGNFNGGLIQDNYDQTGGTAVVSTLNDFGTLSGGTLTVTGNIAQNFTQSGGLLTGTNGSNNNAVILGESFTLSSGTAFVASAKSISQTGGDLKLAGGNISQASTLNGLVSIDGTVGTTQVFSNGVTIGAANSLTMDFTNAGVSDRITILNSPINYDGGLNLNMTTSGTAANATTWQLFLPAAGTTGTFASLSPISSAEPLYNGLTWGLALDSTNIFDQRYGAGIWLSDWSTNGQRFIFNQSSGVLTVVPEPSTVVFAGIGAAMLGWQTWAGRRRKARMKLIEEHTRKLSEQRGLV